MLPFIMQYQAFVHCYRALYKCVYIYSVHFQKMASTYTYTTAKYEVSKLFASLSNYRLNMMLIKRVR